jgi:hypothetical protein
LNYSISKPFDDLTPILKMVSLHVVEYFDVLISLAE